MASGSSYSGGATRTDAFSDFYKEVKTIEKRDADLTSAQQIERLLRPGASYFNLNPFEVMRIDPDSTLDDIKKRYKRMSILLHPDKNPEDRERADKAFDILKKAMTTLEDPDERDRCLKHVHEARARVAKAMDDKRRQLKREGKPQVVDEDDPDKYQQAVWKMTVTVFAERERKRRALDARAEEEKAKAASEVREFAEKRKLLEEYEKNYEESRDDRAHSWKSFKDSKAKKGRYAKGAFKPPKPKAEQRT